MAGIVGALLGGLLTGALALVTDERTAAHDQASFLRDQRLTAYSKISIDNADVANAERALLLQMDARTIDANVIRADYAKIASALDQFRQDTYSVTLLGSRTAADSVSTLLQDHQSFYDSSMGQVTRLASLQTGSNNLSVGNADSYNKDFVPKIAHDVEAFISAAQADLGVH